LFFFCFVFFFFFLFFFFFVCCFFFYFFFSRASGLTRLFFPLLPPTVGYRKNDPVILPPPMAPRPLSSERFVRPCFFFPPKQFTTGLPFSFSRRGNLTFHPAHLPLPSTTFFLFSGCMVEPSPPPVLRKFESPVPSFGRNQVFFFFAHRRFPDPATPPPLGKLLRASLRTYCVPSSLTSSAPPLPVFTSYG